MTYGEEGNEVTDLSLRPAVSDPLENLCKDFVRQSVNVTGRWLGQTIGCFGCFFSPLLYLISFADTSLLAYRVDYSDLWIGICVSLYPI